MTEGLAGHGPRVLLVSPPGLNERALDLLLAACGCRVVDIANSALEAAQLTQASRADVVLLDLTLGEEALICVQVLHRVAPDLGVVALGAPRPMAAQELLDAGLRGFVPISVETTVLTDALQEVADGRPYLDPGLAVADLSDSHGRARPALSDRERQVLGLLAHGLTTVEVAERLDRSPATVRCHIQHAMRKLGARTRAHAIALATGEGDTQAA